MRPSLFVLCRGDREAPADESSGPSRPAVVFKLGICPKLLGRGLRRGFLGRSLGRGFLRRSLCRGLHGGFLRRGLHRTSGYGAASRGGFATASIDVATAAVATVMEQSTTATVAATVATMVTMMATTAAIISAATSVAASTVAAMATMTSDGFAVGTQQGNTDDGEKHRHAQKYDSIHFCIPPFDSLVGVDHKEAAVLASRLQRWRVQGGGADSSRPSFHFRCSARFPCQTLPISEGLAVAWSWALNYQPAGRCQAGTVKVRRMRTLKRLIRGGTVVWLGFQETQTPSI